MGTSKGYEAPKTPQWQALKSQVSRRSADGRPSLERSRGIVSDFIRAGGGSRAIARGGGSMGGGRSAQRAAARVASFASAVAAGGLPFALEQVGLGQLVGRPIGEILHGLLDFLGGPASTIDDVDARNALSRLTDEVLGPLTTPEELEAVLAGFAEAPRLGDLLCTFFAFYIYEQFCRVFYERLVARVGDRTAESFLEGILDFVRSVILEHHLERDVTRVDWTGAEGQEFAIDLMERTLDVFGG